MQLAGLHSRPEARACTTHHQVGSVSSSAKRPCCGGHIGVHDDVRTKLSSCEDLLNVADCASLLIVMSERWLHRLLCASFSLFTTSQVRGVGLHQPRRHAYRITRRFNTLQGSMLRVLYVRSIMCQLMLACKMLRSPYHMNITPNVMSSPSKCIKAAPTGSCP